MSMLSTYYTVLILISEPDSSEEDGRKLSNS
jgi:hypothetical protein